MSDFERLATSNVRRLPVPVEDKPVQSPETQMDFIMHSVGRHDVVKDVLIPMLKERIEQLDNEESDHLGTPRQYEIRGRRMEAKEELSRWLKWSGQAAAPDKESA